MDYGEEPLAPLMWMDDTLNSAGGLEEARQVNIKINTLTKQMGFTLNEDKSVCIIIESKKDKLKANSDLENYPLL